MSCERIVLAGCSDSAAPGDRGDSPPITVTEDGRALQHWAASDVTLGVTDGCNTTTFTRGAGAWLDDGSMKPLDFAVRTFIEAPDGMQTWQLHPPEIWCLRRNVGC